MFPSGFLSDVASKCSSPMRLIMRQHDDGTLEVIQGWGLEQL